MRHPGQAERARRKKHRRFVMYRGGNVPGGWVKFGPYGRRHAARHHAWDVREHLSAVRKAAHAPAERRTPGEPIPKTGDTTVGPGSGTVPLHDMED
jgi:hypothetical protein